MHADLLERRADAVTGKISCFHHDERNGLRSHRFRIGFHREADEACVPAVRDERLRAIDDVLVSVAAGSRCDALQVRARGGFAHRNGANQATARHAGEPLAFLRFAAVREDIMRNIVMNEGMKGHAFAREFLHDDGFVDERASSAAIFRWDIAEQHPYRARFGPGIRIRESLLAPAVLVRDEFGVYKRADGRAKRPQRVTRRRGLVGLGQAGEGDHAWLAIAAT